jgi:hypothetical protein
MQQFRTIKVIPTSTGGRPVIIDTDATTIGEVIAKITAQDIACSFAGNTIVDNFETEYKTNDQTLPSTNCKIFIYPITTKSGK